jgi:hypothetical protein
MLNYCEHSFAFHNSKRDVLVQYVDNIYFYDFIDKAEISGKEIKDVAKESEFIFELKPLFDEERLKQAADEGDANAMYDLGVHYCETYTELSESWHEELCEHCLTKAAEKGHEEAIS